MQRNTNPDPRHVAGGRLSMAIRLHGQDSPQAEAARVAARVAAAEFALRSLAETDPVLLPEQCAHLHDLIPSVR